MSLRRKRPSWLRLRMSLICVVILTAHGAHSEAPPLRSPAIAIAPTSLMALQAQVSTELVQRYDCIVLTRNRGFSLATEHRIDELTAIQQLRESNATVRHADYVVAIRHGDTGDDASQIVFEISYANMQGPDEGEPFDQVFLSNEESMAKPLADRIAERLGLRPRLDVSSPPSEDADGDALIVFPFARYDWLPLDPSSKSLIGSSIKKIQQPPENYLHLQAESEIEKNESGRWRLIDRLQIDQVLTELKLPLHALNDSSSGSALARLVSADAVLLGYVAEEGEGLRIDAHLIDPRSTAIIRSAHSFAENEAALPAKTQEIVTALLQKGLSPFSESFASSPEQRRKEALFLLQSTDRSTATSEVAYMLAGDDRAVRLLIIEKTCSILWQFGSTHKRFPIIQSYILRAAALNEHLLASEEGPLPFPTPSPLIIRAEMHRFMQEYETVYQLAKQYLEHSRADEARALMLLAESAAKTGRRDEARATLNDFLQKYDRDMIFWDVMHNHGGFGRASYIEELLDRDEGDVAMKYANFRERMQDPRHGPTLGQWIHYMELMTQQESDETTQEKLRAVLYTSPYGRQNSELKAGLWYSELVWTWLYLAECELRLGNLRQAGEEARMGLHMATERFERKHFIMGLGARYDSLIERLKRIIDEVEIRIGAVDRVYQPLSITQAWPNRYTVYVVPVGVWTDESEALAKEFTDFYGARVEILDPVMPSDELRRDRKLFKERLAYEVEALWKDVVPRMRIPEDALYVILYSSDLYYFKHWLSRPWSEVGGNPLLTGVQDPRRARLVSLLNRRQAVLLGFYAATDGLTGWADSNPDVDRRKMDVERCAHPCIFYQTMNQPYGSHLACPQCQEAFRTMDFDAMHRNLMEYLHSMGATIIPTEHAD